MTNHSPETVALARMAGARMVRVLAAQRVTGAAILAAVGDALVAVTADGLPPTAGARAYGYDLAGARTSSPLNNETAIVVWTTNSHHRRAAETIDGETCPSCGAVLVWGAGPSCPNDCPEVDR